ncbi:MAG: menaquinone biosynthesis protein [Pirellula sp.]|nr:menaquinone biosynthesis protein [Pirellula sp.]
MSTKLPNRYPALGLGERSLPNTFGSFEFPLPFKQVSHLRSLSCLPTYPAELAGESALRIGAVSYLNSKPLIEDLALSLGENGRLSTDLPSRLADQLHRNEIDLGLIPVFEYFQNESFRLVSTSGIACRGPVWSVRLFFRCPPSQVKTLALDEGSRTSAALSKVLLHEELGRIPETRLLPIDSAPESIDADAVLLIGDRAMHPERYENTFIANWDLGQVWWERTGLPFVFAAWVARPGISHSHLLGKWLDQVREYGKERISEISTRLSPSYELTPEQCVDYLTHYIHFEIDQEARAGLEEFRRKCHDLGLVRTENT